MKDIPFIDKHLSVTIEQNSLINGPTSRPSLRACIAFWAIYKPQTPMDDNKWCRGWVGGGDREYVPGNGHLNACPGRLYGITEVCPGRMEQNTSLSRGTFTSLWWGRGNANSNIPSSLGGSPVHVTCS